MTTDVVVDRRETLEALTELILNSLDTLASDIWELLALADEAVTASSDDLNLSKAQKMQAVRKALGKADDVADLALGRAVRERLAGRPALDGFGEPGA